MVVTFRTYLHIPFAALTLLVVGTGAQAQSILKQMQAEVSSIVTKTRSAVVTIEETMDTAALRKDAVTTTPSAGKAALTVEGKANPLNALSFDYVMAASPRSGTGFSIGEGYVVTTADVAQNMKNPVVVTDSGKRLRASIVGTDQELNVGLVRLQAKEELPALNLGDSSSLAVGHFALSIGNQSGQDNSVALMLIGGLRNEGVATGNHFYPSLIQIAGTVGVGTSGAPLVNVEGQVVGIMAGVPADDLSLAWVNKPPARTTEAYNRALSNWHLQLPTGQSTSQISQPYRAKLDFQKTARSNIGPNTRLFESPKVGTKFAPSNKTHYRNPKNTPATRPKLTRTQTKGVASKNNPPKNETKAVESLYTFYDVAQSPASQNSVFFRLDNAITSDNGAVVPTFRSPVSSAGFAVPINELKATIEALKSGQSAVHGWLGVQLETESKSVELNGVITITPRVVISGIYMNSPAYKTSLQPGDVVLQLNDMPVQSENDVRARVLRLQVGEPVRVRVQRLESEPTIDLLLERRPEQITDKIITKPSERLNGK